MYSIGKLCREFNLSRSTLLYYDSIGLLAASGRSASNYREYSETDRVRLEQICAFREAGVSLEQIKELLDKDPTYEDRVLEKRLNEISQEIRYLRAQQRIIVEMFKARNADNKSILIDKETFTSILKSSGLDDKTMDQLHIQFERQYPDAHQFFLEFLGLSDEAIKHIREMSR